MPDRIAEGVTRDVNTFLPLIVANGLNVVGAIAILIIGLWLSGKAHTLVARVLSRTPHMDQMLIGFFGAIVRYLILTVTFLAVLSQFGIQTTSLIAVLGAAGLAVGLSLQGTLSNLAAGVMLLIFRPFRIGHSVQVGGIQGTVRELSLFWTELVTPDNVQIIVPNGSVWGQPLRNFSFYPVRGIELHFSLADTVDLDRALASVRSLLESDARIVDNPAPSAALDHGATDNSLQLVVKVWTSAGNVAAVKTDLIRSVRETLGSESVREHTRAG
ncbi:MAG TPA: mechanosensitive ion channel domain-containing protein [Acetobacteraceae bacterium]|jgi:small conductance mechanosensitive channel